MGRRKQPAPAVRGWASLTWDDLHRWAGSRSVDRGDAYHRAGRVRDLARLGEDRLLAWVQGTECYATEVRLLPEGDVTLCSRCSCPVGFDRCKHAVAVVLAYLAARDSEVDVPAATEEDDRLDILQRERQPGPVREPWEVDEDLAGAESIRAQTPPSADHVRAYLQAKSHDELVEYVLRLAEEYPEVREELTETAALASPDVQALIRQTRAEIHRRTAEEAQRNHWDDEGHVPDYGGVRRRFERLLEAGAADAVLELGRELFEQGRSQVAEADDEGETGYAIGECLKVVFRAVPSSSLPGSDQLLYAIDLLLDDQHDLCEGAWSLIERDWPADAWSAVADALTRRLGPPPGQPIEDFSRRHRRDRVTNLLIRALTSAGRAGEVIPLCEAEARITGSYERLVARLIDAGRPDDAVRWAWEGVAQHEAHAPGIAHELRKTLREIAAARGDSLTAAALRADEFFRRPDVQTFQDLLEAARQAKCEPAVRAAALRFLETGERPAVAAGKISRKARSDWPLPALPMSGSAPAGPQGSERYLDVLLDIALAEGRPNEALRWYDQMNEERQRRSWAADLSRAARVAEAVATTQPDRAIALYQNLAESHMSSSKPIAYEPTGRYLSRLRELLIGQQREATWSAYVSKIRDEYRRKRSLMEVLDHVEHPRISRKGS